MVISRHPTQTCWCTSLQPFHDHMIGGHYLKKKNEIQEPSPHSTKTPRNFDEQFIQKSLTSLLAAIAILAAIHCDVSHNQYKNNQLVSVPEKSRGPKLITAA